MRGAMTMELETTEKVPVERLRLDRGDPRLGGEAGQASDEWVIARLYRSAELDELLQSMSANGYLDIERLVVMGDRDADDGGLIVLEGNRRLAALRLLREPDLVRRIESAESLRILVPTVDDSLRATFDEVSVYHVASRGARAGVHGLQAHERAGEVGRVCESEVRGRLASGRPGWWDRPGTDRGGHRRSARYGQADGLGDLRAGAGGERGALRHRQSTIATR